MKLIIFDFDGTLGDTCRNIVTTLQQTMRAQGLEVRDEATCRATIGLTLENSFATMYPGMTAAEADECARVYRQLFEENRKMLVPQPFPHVVDTLRQLHGRGLVMAVASSRNSSSLKGFLHDMGIAPFIAHVVGADNVSHPKPHPEPVLQILAALGVEPQDTMVVGDMAVDMLMGANAGTATCGVTYGNGSRQELLDGGADHVIDDMAELPALFQG